MTAGGIAAGLNHVLLNETSSERNISESPEPKRLGQIGGCPSVMIQKFLYEFLNPNHTSALTHSEDTGSLSSLARIEAADAFQTNGFGSALCSAR